MKKHLKYLHRDVSWMYFNHRILQEALKDNVPLLERLSFLGIYSNNLDEFFRVRVASISRIAECEDKAAHDEQEQAHTLLRKINQLNNRYAKEYGQAVATVTEQLRRWYDIDFFFTSEDVKHFVFAGVIKKYYTANEIFSIIEKTARVKFTVNGRTVVVSRR